MKEDHRTIRLRLLKALLHLGILVCGILLIISYFSRVSLPDAGEVHEELYNSPLQEDTLRPDFLFNYRGVVYDVHPVAEYQLNGLIVSHNNINSLADIYHDDDSVDLKDVCVIWGNNVKTNDFQEVSYESNAWTCSYSYFDNIEFNHNEIANNHLLAADKSVQKKIRNFKIGDQIRLTGMLVNYRRAGTEYARQSSISREDTGNGACEVLFVEEAEVIARSQPMWVKIYDWSKWGFVVLIISRVLLFFILAHYERKAFEQYEKYRLARLEQRNRMGRL